MSEGEEQECVVLSKVVYFDEGSAIDYIQIVNGGQISIVRERQSQSDRNASTEVRGKVDIKARLIEILTGIGASAEAAGDAGISFDTSIVAKIIISSTVLTGFLEAITENKVVKSFKGYAISPINNSFASLALMAPYFDMLRGSNIPVGDFNLILEKFDSTIKNAKGYFEFLGENDSERIVFRFNNSSFENNYKIRDLMQMDLVIYAVKVGKCKLEDLEVTNELNVLNGTAMDKPDYECVKASKDGQRSGELFVYDALLAGVKSNG